LNEDARLDADGFAVGSERTQCRFAEREQRARFSGDRVIETGRTEVARGRVRVDEQLTARCAVVDARRERYRPILAQRASQPLEERAPYQSSGSTKTWIVPPQVRPCAIASPSLMP
jgi:hypothetical protein